MAPLVILLILCLTTLLKLSKKKHQGSLITIIFVNLRFCVKKLQQKLTIIFESLDFNIRLGSAKKNNPAFANFLLDVSDSSSSCLVTQIPQVYGLFLDDVSFMLSMRLRSFIWPNNLPHGLICKCGKNVTLTHLLNCNRFITFRSKVHDAVRDQLLLYVQVISCRIVFRTYAC